MKDKDNIKELFSEKLGNYEAKVNPELWTNIASQVGGAGTTVATGLSVATKWFIGVSIATAIIVTTKLFVNNKEEPASLIDNDIIKAEKTRDPEKTKPTENKIVVNQQLERVHHQEAGNNKQQNLNTDAQEPFAEEKENEPDVTFADQPEETQLIIKENKTGKEEGENFMEKELITQNAAAEKEIEQDIIVTEPFGPEEVNDEEVQFFIGELPNVITPNGDGNNDLFEIKSSNLTGFSITILNDENKAVYQSNNPNFSWDATDGFGQPVPEGRYVYFITAKEFTQDKPRRYSSLTVIR